MLVKRLPPIFSLSFLLFPITAGAFQAGQGDWRPVKVDPNLLAVRAEKMMSTFQNVACGGRMVYQIPIPNQKPGRGQALFNALFWTTKKYRFDYLVFGDHPTKEYLASDGKVTRRVGPDVPKTQLSLSPPSRIFSAASDSQLVAQWPIHFSKFLFAKFAGGNATLGRYVKALAKGVGGYQVRVEQRKKLTGGKTYDQFRLYATKGRAGTANYGRVEIVFDSHVGLPVTINTNLGPAYQFNWTGQWYNHAKLPADPFKIDR